MPELLAHFRALLRMPPSRESLIETYGICHTANFVHFACLNEFTERLPTKDRSIFHVATHDLSEASKRPRDITSCDVCGKEFHATDNNGAVIRTVELSELTAYLKVQSRRRPTGASPG